MRIATTGLIAAALVLPVSPLAAQSPASWPQRPVKIILPLGPGSGSDIGARLLAEKLSVRWAQPVVVENRPGGDGIVAINTFANARDDHILLFAPAASFTAHPYLHDKMPYDPRDLSPVARVSSTLVTLTTPPKLDVKSLGDLLAMARAQPGKLNWASATGATDFLLQGFFKIQGVEMAKVPYRDPSQAVNDVAEGRLHFYWSAHAIVRAPIEAGRVRPLAIAASRPSAVAPGIPTVAQAGFPGLTFDGLVGFYGTRDLPTEVRTRIAADVRAALDDPVIVGRLHATGQEAMPGSAAEFAADIDKQRAGMAATAKVLGVKAAP